VSDDPLNPKTFGSRAARAVLWLLRGWKIETTNVAAKRSVMIAVPHTTNLDGLLLVLLTRSVGMNANWMVKDVWLKPPFGWLIRRVGAIPVNRSKATGMVGQMVERFDRNEPFQLLVPPEGTRSLTEEWKSGFYRIAVDAGVPITPTYLDYRRRRGGFLEPIIMTGDVDRDMAAIREVYPEAKQMAKHPEKFGPIRLGAESD
jgi:1-acyl-sn-glycerol-3-phosphate acyltransferase